MTVITKPLTDKKTNQLKEPLVENADLQSVVSNPDVESATPAPKYIILGARARHVTTSTTLCLFLTALLVMGVGVIGGMYVYRQFTRQQFQRFHGWCNIPYGTGKSAGSKDYRGHQESLLADSILFESHVKGGRDDAPVKSFPDGVRGSFRQDFELDLENESFEKIEVPDLGYVRKGRFIHDFRFNKTGIVDEYSRRCFIMPLNRQRVYRPRVTLELIMKMWTGNNEVDTEVIRETMTPLLPPVIDFKGIGEYLEQECRPMRTYMLKKREDGISKRSATLDEPVFAEFAGSKISEFVIDVSPAEEYERAEASKP